MSKYSQALRNGARGNTQSRLGERNRRLNKWYINVANVCHGVATLRGANPLGANTQSSQGSGIEERISGTATLPMYAMGWQPYSSLVKRLIHHPDEIILHPVGVPRNLVGVKQNHQIFSRIDDVFRAVIATPPV